MGSVPVGETILRAYSFAARRALALFGLGWLSAVFYAGATAYFLGRLSAAMLVWPRPAAGSFNDFALFHLFCLVVATALANAAMGVPLTREALEPGGEWKSAYFVMARREWSLFLGLVRVYGMVIGAVLAIVFAGGVAIAVSLPLIGHDGIWQGISLPPLMSAAIALIAAATGLLLAIRFGFFVAPMASDDPPVRLLHVWTLSRGNFWRLLAVTLALLLPVFLLCLLVEWAALGSQLTSAIGSVMGDGRDNIAFFQLIRDHALTIASVWAGSLLVLNALFASATADAYRQVEHNASPAKTEFVSFGEPAYALSPQGQHVPASERVEPGFVVQEQHPIAPVEHVAAVAAEPETRDIVSIANYEKPHLEPLVPDKPGVEALPPAEPSHADEIHADLAPAHAEPVDSESSTPLPSFVQKQSSPANDPSEAA